jgi:hypothetical protein
MLRRLKFLHGRYINYARGYYASVFTDLIGFTILEIMHQNLDIVPEIIPRLFSVCMMSLALCFCLAIIGPNLPEAFNTNEERDKEEQKTHDTAVDLVGFGITCGLPALLALVSTIVTFIIF